MKYFISGEQSSECLDVLVDFVEEFDLSVIMPMLPDDMDLAIISNILRRALRLKIHKVSLAKKNLNYSSMHAVTHVLDVIIF